MMVLDPTFLGTVQDVTGATVSVALDANTVSGLSFIDGQGYRIGQVGSFVRIPMGYVDLFGVVSQVGAGAVPLRLVEDRPFGNRWLTVQLVGEGQRHGTFQRGVSQHPTVGDKVHLLTEGDLRRVYGQPEAANFVRVGHLASAESIPALVDVDKLVTRHSAVVGATGAGKSTTVAGLLVALSDPARYPSARIIVLDIHGEYAKALADRATVFRLNPRQERGEQALYIPYWALNFDELVTVTLAPLDDTGRAAVLEKVSDLKKEALAAAPRRGVTADSLTVDSPVPFSIHQMWFDLHTTIHATHIEGAAQSRETWALETDAEGNPEAGDALRVIPPKFRPIKDERGDPEKIRLSRSPLNIRRPLESLASKLRDPRFRFLFDPGPWRTDLQGQAEMDLDSLLEAWIGGERPISILDLLGIPVAILNELIGALLRVLYDAVFWARNLPEGGRERPLLVVLEEAHAYLQQAGAGEAALAVRRITKEGRKYGIGAMIVSQRPAEIDITILSQCGTLFAMRLANPTDRGHVTGAVTDNLGGLFSMLPVLRTGEAIIVGEAVNLPVRTLIDPPAKNRRPDSEDPKVVVQGNSAEGYEGPGGWNQPRDRGDYEEVVELWRRQSPRVERAQRPRGHEPAS